jgi:RNA polymerase sigma-70 factor (ECF subfamily)
VIFLHDEDNVLMEKVKDGDKTAYETLVIKHRAKAINFAYSFISDLYEAEDVIQECFVKAYINRMSYNPSNTFKTYLFTVIRNCCIDYLRQNKKNRKINLDDISEIADNISPEDSFIQTERMATILSHLDSLPDDYKTALYLLAFDEMSYNEIAEVMRKSIPQIKIIIHRARKKLKKLCEGDDIFEK